MHTYEFSLYERVKLAMSGETGTVIGRFEAIDHPPQYRVRYVAADGRQVSDWFWASELKENPYDLSAPHDEGSPPPFAVDLKSREVFISSTPLKATSPEFDHLSERISALENARKTEAEARKRDKDASSKRLAAAITEATDRLRGNED